VSPPLRPLFLWGPQEAASGPLSSSAPPIEAIEHRSGGKMGALELDCGRGLALASVCRPAAEIEAGQMGPAPLERRRWWSVGSAAGGPDLPRETVSSARLDWTPGQAGPNSMEWQEFVIVAKLDSGARLDIGTIRPAHTHTQARPK